MLCRVPTRLAGLCRLCLSMIWPFRIPSRTTIWPTWGSNNSSIPSSNNKVTLPSNNKVTHLSNNKAILPSNIKAILPSSTSNSQ